MINIVMPQKLFTTANVKLACDRGKHVLDTYIPRCPSPAVVFDVDETLLLNHPSDDGRFRPNPSVVELYNYASSAGAIPYVVTARRKSPWSVAFLRKQLNEIGANQPKKIYMVNKDYDNDSSASRFKRDARGRIQDRHNKQILLNVGDQCSDMFLTGEFSTENSIFERQLGPSLSYGLIDPTDPALLSLKLPSSYVVP